MAKASGQAAVLGKGLQVRGRVRGDGDLNVQAAIEGDVSVTGALLLDAEARVSGDVEADSVVVSGVLEGDVTATGAVTITASGSLRGDVKSAELSIEEGARFSGRVEADFQLPEAIA